MADALFGWDLTFKTVEKDIKRKSDVIVAFIHWNLTKRGFRSIGIGDERTLSGDEEKTELLPTGWNDKDNYALRYLLDSKLFILHGLNTDGNLIVNLMRSEDLVVSNIAVKIDETVKYLTGPIDKMMPNHKELIYQVKRDLIDIVTERATVTAETQTSRRKTASDILKQLGKDGLDIQLCRAQGYDNAASMSGVHGGVQKKIRDINHKALFSPCANHSLNLCGVHSFACIPSSVICFGTLEKIYSFFSASTHRWGQTLKRLCDTRWSAHHDFVKGVRQNVEQLVLTARGPKLKTAPGLKKS